MEGLLILVGLCLIFSLGFVVGALWTASHRVVVEVEDCDVAPPAAGFQIDRSRQPFWN